MVETNRGVRLILNVTQDFEQLLDHKTKNRMLNFQIVKALKKEKSRKLRQPFENQGQNTRGKGNPGTKNYKRKSRRYIAEIIITSDGLNPSIKKNPPVKTYHNPSTYFLLIKHIAKTK